MAKNLKIVDKIIAWGKDRNLYIMGDVKTQTLKLGEEYGELSRAVIKKDKPNIKDALGDMFVVMVGIAEHEDMRIEDCIESAYNVIKNRKGKMFNGNFVKNE